MKTITALFALILAGCATPPAIQGATPETITINWGTSGMENAPGLAEQHCAQYGKHAQFAGKEDFFIFYNCVRS